jgi:hypothetical protein
MTHPVDPQFPPDHAQDDHGDFIYDQRCWLCRHITCQPAPTARPDQPQQENP